MLESLVNKFSIKKPEISKSQFRNILILSLSMLLAQTVCLHKLKGVVGQITGKERTKPASNYQRLLRLFRHHAFSRLWLDLLRFVFQLLRLQSDCLTLDGTSWQRGNKWHHYLVLGVVYQGVAIPIYWVNLQKQGMSNIKERKCLMKRALRSFNLKDKTLLADREYIGIDWFKFLIDKDISFVIRLKKNIYHGAINAIGGKTVAELIQKVKRSKIPHKSVRKAFELEGMKLYFVVSKNPDKNAKEEFLFLITNLEKPASALTNIYRIRWKIEHCFKQLKSNGFDLEAMNVKGKAKQNLLLAIVVFTYVLSVLEGLKEYKKIPLKKYANGTVYKAISVFRNGLDKIILIANSFECFCRYILEQLSLNKHRYRSIILLNVQ
jgi:hypothetical protein